MNKLEKPSSLEKLSGSLITQSAFTGLAAYIGTPLSALLPMLSGSLASSRHIKRVEKTLNEINDKFIEQEEKIKNLSDSQYKLINETILTILQTTEDDKIKYLKKVIDGSINEDIIPITLSSQLSRIIRDISAEEITFLIKNIDYAKVVFLQNTNLRSDLYIEPHSHDSTLAAGLISMGLLVPGDSTIDNIGTYQFSTLSKELLKILGS